MIRFYNFCAQKKLSIPNTVARVLDYVPQLQRQLEKLERTKEEIVKRMQRAGDLGGGSKGGGSPVVSIADLGGGEVAIQVCAYSGDEKKGMMSAVLEYFASEGILTVSASTLAVDSRRTQLNLHCQVFMASSFWIIPLDDLDLYLIFAVTGEECFDEVGSGEAQDESPGLTELTGIPYLSSSSRFIAIKRIFGFRLERPAMISDVLLELLAPLSDLLMSSSKDQGFFRISQFIWDPADPLFFLFKDQRFLVQDLDESCSKTSQKIKYFTPKNPQNDLQISSFPRSKYLLIG